MVESTLKDMTFELVEPPALTPRCLFCSEAAVRAIKVGSSMARGFGFYGLCHTCLIRLGEAFAREE